ncbi:MAG: hypothetical protein WCV86_03415 [Patescibacteria group bacterium]|jgi:hypothetical protein
MKNVLLVFAAIFAWYVALALFALQSALGGLWLFLPLSSLLTFVLLVNQGIGFGIVSAALIGLGLDLYLPFPFGTFLLAYPAAVIALFFLFRTVFTRETSFSAVLTIASGILLSDFLAWLLMHVLLFFGGEGDVLSMTRNLSVLFIERMFVGLGLYLLVLLFWRVVLQPIITRLFMAPNHGTGR